MTYKLYYEDEIYLDLNVPMTIRNYYGKHFDFTGRIKYITYPDDRETKVSFEITFKTTHRRFFKFWQKYTITHKQWRWAEDFIEPVPDPVITVVDCNND